MATFDQLGRLPGLGTQSLAGAQQQLGAQSQLNQQYANWDAAAKADAQQQVAFRYPPSDIPKLLPYTIDPKVSAALRDIFRRAFADKPQAVPTEHSGVIPHECPACAAHALNKRLDVMRSPEINLYGEPTALPVQDDFAKPEGLAGKADEVIKGILDGELSRPKVKQIGDAVAERTKKDGGSDALGGAIGRSNKHGSFMERRTPYSN